MYSSMKNFVNMFQDDVLSTNPDSILHVAFIFYFTDKIIIPDL